MSLISYRYARHLSTMKVFLHCIFSGVLVWVTSRSATVAAAPSAIGARLASESRPHSPLQFLLYRTAFRIQIDDAVVDDLNFQIGVQRTVVKDFQIATEHIATDSLTIDSRPSSSTIWFCLLEIEIKTSNPVHRITIYSLSPPFISDSQGTAEAALEVL